MSIESEQIAVVDEDNRFVRWEIRRVIHEQRLVHRSAYVLLFDSRGRLLIQRRHPGKQTFPDYWDISTAGHVAREDYPAGPDDDLETVYRETAQRELAEELGITAPLEELAHFPPTPGVHYEQVRLFRAVSDAPVTLQESEVSESRWVTPEELAVLLDDPAAKVTGALRFVTDQVLR